MILSDGTNTREEVARPGPWCDGMAVYLDQFYMNGDTGDDMSGNEPDGSGGIRYGRRILWWDSNGFISSTRHKDADEAQDALTEAFPYDEEDE